MTLAQARKAYQLLTEVQMMLGDLPKSKALKAYNKLNKVKAILKKSQLKLSKKMEARGLKKQRILKALLSGHVLTPMEANEIAKSSDAQSLWECA